MSLLSSKFFQEGECLVFFQVPQPIYIQGGAQKFSNSHNPQIEKELRNLPSPTAYKLGKSLEF